MKKNNATLIFLKITLLNQSQSILGYPDYMQSFVSSPLTNWALPSFYVPPSGESKASSVPISWLIEREFKKKGDKSNYNAHCWLFKIWFICIHSSDTIFERLCIRHIQSSAHFDIFLNVLFIFLKRAGCGLANARASRRPNQKRHHSRNIDITWKGFLNSIGGAGTTNLDRDLAMGSEEDLIFFCPLLQFCMLFTSGKTTYWSRWQLPPAHVTPRHSLDWDHSRK